MRRAAALFALVLAACGESAPPEETACAGDDAFCAVVSWNEPDAGVEVHVIRDGADACSDDDCVDDDCAFLDYRASGAQVALAAADDPGEPFVVVVVARLRKTPVKIETADGARFIELTPNEARTVLSFPRGGACDAGAFDFACGERAPPCP